MDKSWLQKIYLEHQNLAYRIAVSIIKDVQLAEDIVQDVFVTLYYKGDHIRDKDKVKAWLIRTTANRAIDFTRKYKRVVTLPSDYFDQVVGNPWSDPTREIDKKEIIREVRESLDSLPADLKMLVVLYYFMEMPQKDMAEVLEIPANTVKTRLRRARLIMKKCLQKTAHEKVAPLSPEKGVSKHD